jgi:FixJ family two-component response regulator
VPASVEAMKAGAVDFLEKPIRDQALLAAIERAARRSRSLRKSLDELKQLQKRYDLLTPRQRQVFAMVTSGMLNKQIGYELGATEKTIKVHRARVMEKMGASSLADLVRMAEFLTRNADVTTS